MNKEEVYNKLKEIITVYLPEDVNVGDITTNSHLINHLNINSSHLVDVVLDVEDAFNIEIKDEELQEMDTVNSAIDLILKKLS